MEWIQVEGGVPLRGEVTVQGAKNSVLPILAATILTGGICEIENCPHLSDVDCAMEILRHLGCVADREEDFLRVDARALTHCDVPEEMMRRMRSSVIFLGAILSRLGEAEMSYPGGCELGARPIDFHLSALRTLGAEIEEHGGFLHCRAPALHGGEITLSLPSVGATENAILCACGARGVTVIHNAAREPEIWDLQEFLRACGAQVCGAGSSTITVEGGRTLHGCRYKIIADRIAAATYLCAAAATGGEINLREVDYRHLSSVTTVLGEAGCHIRSFDHQILLQAPPQLTAVSPVRTAPYPGFPTDAQAVLMAALLKSQGATVFVENIFQSRYRHVPEMLRMGADIRLEGRVAVACGVEHLRAATVRGTDLRGGAALVVAALQAEGTARVEGIEHIERGYDRFAEHLARLGGRVKRMQD
jgi:UDP-N-acetylglucosamine 1-carboxyvinyltransferase